MRRFAVLGILLLVAACGGAPTGERAGDPPDAAPAPAEQKEGTAGPAATAGLDGTLRLYTTVTEETVTEVVAAFRERNPAVEVEVFRAPTGELNARIAAERREGGLRADVLWLTDPLSMEAFDAEGLLAPYEPADVDVVPAAYRTETSVGTRLLNLVVVARPDVDPTPRRWDDLTEDAYAGAVAFPDPGFAGSAFAALGYFALADGDLRFFEGLADNGAVQVQAPGEVVTGVAEGRFDAGITLDQAARTAIDKGSPLEIIVPEEGAIAVYSPIAVVEGSEGQEIAESFVDFTITTAAQEAIASTGWQPIRADVAWPHTMTQVSPSWSAIAARQDELLEEYRAIFDG
jgi:iron(III) transport system substrate-binding protein